MFNKVNKIYFVILILSALLLIIFLSQNFVNKSTKVAATVYPLYDITRNIAGNDIETVLLLEPGASPHTFDPTPKEIKNLSGSEIVFTIGHGLDDWSLKLANSAGVKKTVTVDRSIELLDTNEGVNPHYWLSPKNAMIIAVNIKDELIKAYPLKQNEIQNNYDVYIKKLEKLDSDITSSIKNLKTNQFATFHNAWDYFAKDYGLVVTTTFEEFPGREPTSQYLNEFTNTIKNENIKVIYAEPQFSTAPLLPIAADLKITLSFLDPIGGTPGKETYIDLMRYNLNQLTSQLK